MKRSRFRQSDSGPFPDSTASFFDSKLVHNENSEDGPLLGGAFRFNGMTLAAAVEGPALAGACPVSLSSSLILLLPLLDDSELYSSFESSASSGPGYCRSLSSSESCSESPSFLQWLLQSYRAGS